MSLREGPLGDIRVPLTWSAAAALVIAAIIAGALLLSRQHDPVKTGAYDAARHVVDTVAAPVGGALSAPGRWIREGMANVGDYFMAGSQNHKMRAALAGDRSLRDELSAVEADNARLRAVLGIKTDPPLPQVAARTIAESRGPFSTTRLADAGRDKGVTEGNPVISEHGLVGRIEGVSDHVSRVLVLTDSESRVPVVLLRTNGRAILTGDGGAAPKLDFIRSALGLKDGDRVMTSGDGGVFPRGLPVGTVARGYDGVWRVLLDSDAAPIEYVQILLFTDFGQLTNAQSLAPRDLPTAMTEEPSQSIAQPATATKPAAAKPAAVKPAAAKPAGATKPTAAAASIKPGAKPKPAHAAATRAAP